MFSEKKITDNMAVKTDDIDSIDLDADLLLSYALGPLSLEDIFEPDEIKKKDSDSDAENDVSPGDNKITKTDAFKCAQSRAVKKSTAVSESCGTEVKVQTSSRKIKRKRDINGNVEVSSDENVSELFSKLELSDSDNEDADDEDSSKLRERGRQKSERRANRPRKPYNIARNDDIHDVSQFNSERLRFLAGSSKVTVNETIASNPSVINLNIFSEFTGYESHNTEFSGCESRNNLLSVDKFLDSCYEANFVSSPESGYDSSAQSAAGSPPPPPLSMSASQNLDLIPETVDEQIILEFLAENSDGALIDNNLSVCNTDEKDYKDEIKKLKNFLLKDAPAQLSKSPIIAAVSDNNILNHVPLVCQFEDPSNNFVKLPPVSKSLEVPKKLVYKLDDKAKKALRNFLSKEDFYAALERIYKKIIEDRENNRDIKIIYVEDEEDKASENQTNLHHAVLDSKIEDIYCLVEIHKQYNKPFTDINIRDKHGKTALDYAIQKKMTLVVDYLKENTACQSVNIK